MRLLDAAFKPRRVAVVGASEAPGKLGTVLMENLSAYEGEVIPVTRSGDVVAGRRAYPSLREVPGPVDLAVVAVPAEQCPDVLRDAGQAGVRVAVVLSAGFAETGPDGAALQHALVQEARRAGVRVVGPNCFGLIDCHRRLNASIAAGTPTSAGGVSLVTQSGAYGMAIYSLALDQRMAFAKVYAAGNKADITDAEVLEYLVTDPDTRIVCFFLESVRDGRAFVDVVRAATRSRPVLVTKTGRTGAGARAARSHTAAMAGRADVWRQVLESAGAVVLRSGLEMMDVARALDFQPWPTGRRVGIVTNSGGTGVELADLLEEEGLEVPPLSVKTQDRLRELLPPFASAQNPVDMTPAWARFRELYPFAIRTLVESGETDAVVVVLLQRSALDPAVTGAVLECVRTLRDEGTRVPVYVCWVAPREAQENLDRLQEAGIPCFEWPERTARAVAGAVRAAQALRTRAPDLRAPPTCRPRQVLPEGLLPPEVANRVLGEFGLPVVDWRLCGTPQEAVGAARELGYPVVAKVTGVLHKSEVGGVRVGLRSTREVRRAARELLEMGGPVLLQRQVSGTEVAVGGLRDPDLGPVVMVGMGGTLVELLGDVAFRPAPVSAEEAEAALATLRGFPILKGWRGARAANLGGLARCVARASELLASHPEVEEMDLNPVIVSPDGVWVVDARIVVGARSGRDEEA